MRPPGSTSSYSADPHGRAVVLLVGIAADEPPLDGLAVDDETPALDADSVARKADRALDDGLARARVAEEHDVAAFRQAREEPAVLGWEAR